MKKILFFSSIAFMILGAFGEITFLQAVPFILFSGLTYLSLWKNQSRPDAIVGLCVFMFFLNLSILTYGENEDALLDVIFWGVSSYVFRK